MKRILIVDDEQVVLDGMQRMLDGQQCRWETHFAHSGEAALDACVSMPFDVVLADVGMPDIDGIALLQILRDQYPGCARVLLSAQGDLARAGKAAEVAYRVLVKPLHQLELLTNLERVFTLQESFATDAMRGAIGQIGGLPSLSRTYTALTLAIRDPESSIAEVAAIIDQDMAMAAKVLQMVNSGFFGLAKPMVSVAAAVSYLGMETMKNLTLATETFTLFSPDASVPRNFLETTHRRAERAAIIVGALPISPRDRDVCVVGALLHDIGELVLASRMPLQLCASACMAKERNCAGEEAETTLMGVSHAEIGGYLLGLWGVRGVIVEAVAHHHRPGRVRHIGFDCSAAVYLAALIADELETHPEDLTGAALRPGDQESLKALGLLDRYPVLRARAMKALQMR